MCHALRLAVLRPAHARYNAPERWCGVEAGHRPATFSLGTVRVVDIAEPIACSVLQVRAHAGVKVASFQTERGVVLVAGSLVALRCNSVQRVLKDKSKVRGDF